MNFVKRIPNFGDITMKILGNSRNEDRFYLIPLINQFIVLLGNKKVEYWKCRFNIPPFINF